LAGQVAFPGPGAGWFRHAIDSAWCNCHRNSTVVMSTNEDAALQFILFPLYWIESNCEHLCMALHLAVKSALRRRLVLKIGPLQRQSNVTFLLRTYVTRYGLLISLSGTWCKVAADERYPAAYWEGLLTQGTSQSCTAIADIYRSLH